MSSKNNPSSLTPPAATFGGNWFYMNPEEITAGQIYSVIKEQFPKLPAELWNEAGVVELPLSSKSSIDIEQTMPQFADESGTQFLKEHRIQSLYLVTFPAEDYEKAVPYFHILCARLGGFFCADTSDFTPRICTESV